MSMNLANGSYTMVDGAAEWTFYQRGFELPNRYDFTQAEFEGFENKGVLKSYLLSMFSGNAKTVAFLMDWISCVMFGQKGLPLIILADTGLYPLFPNGQKARSGKSTVKNILADLAPTQAYISVSQLNDQVLRRQLRFSINASEYALERHPRKLTNLQMKHLKEALDSQDAAWITTADYLVKITDPELIEKLELIVIPKPLTKPVVINYSRIWLEENRENAIKELFEHYVKGVHLKPSAHMLQMKEWMRQNLPTISPSPR